MPGHHFLQYGQDPLAIGSKNLLGIIGGAIVDHDHFEVGIDLRQNTVDAWAQILAVIEIVDKHR